MGELKNLFTSLHHIDLENNSLEEKEVHDGDLEEYITDLIEKIFSRNDDRLFGVKRESTEVISSIMNLVSGEIDFHKTSNIIADRLFNIEKDTQEKLMNFTSLKKGSLVQSFIEDGDNRIYVITKVEHGAFIDDLELKKRIGLPFEKTTLKTCLLQFNEDNELIDIRVNDSNNKISKYWWDDFLEVKELNSDEANTNLAFKAVEQYLAKKVKDKSSVDHTILRNNLIGYFRTQENFAMNHMVDTVFGSYQPINSSEIDIDGIKNDVNDLPESKKFDRRFNIVSEKINKRMKYTIKVNKNIYLDIRDHIDGLNDIIKAVKEDNGEKYLKIKTTDEVFEQFNFRNEE